MTTPFEREILSHHYISHAPFPRPTELYWLTVNSFVDAGLLFRDLNGGDNQVRANQPALDVYMAALAAVPLPIRVWAMPPSPTTTGKP